MFQFILTFGASLDIKNTLGYTPITLAAHLARKEVKLSILKYLKYQ